MDSRASARTRLSVLPVFIALMFNLMAPVFSIAAPELAPAALAPEVAVAADAPEQVTFTLEGCNLGDGSFIEATLTCTEPAYTTGNLDKFWAELDRVPHRLTAENKNGDQTYEITIAADYLLDGTIGYDLISVPTLKSGSCTFVVSDQFTSGPAAGGADQTIARTLTITQPADSTCVFDYNMRLGLGAADYSGSSLHAYLQAEGVGEKRVPLPVSKEFPAQELRKTMSATQGQAHTWSVSKSSDPLSLDFPNTCLTTPSARSATVDVTVSWTRSGPTASGSTLITTEIYAKNPSERTIQVSVSDDIFAGVDQSGGAIDNETAGPVSVPANTESLILAHSFEYDGEATQFNDVATATYTDPVNPDVMIPGTTTTTANATAAPAGGTAANATATITDSEWITGDGLSFSVAALEDGEGTFTNGYVAGTSVLPGSTVEWSSGTVDGSGSATFTKTVTVDEPRITSGMLSDVASVVPIGGGTALANSGQLDIDITTDAEVSLTINKTIPAGALRSGESVTFNFNVTGSDEDASITFNFGDPLTKSTVLSGLAPGEYTVSEQPQANWADHVDQSTTITLPECDGSVAFNNAALGAGLNLIKTADGDPIDAGEQASFTILIWNAGPGTALDAAFSDALPAGMSWSFELVNGDQDDACASSINSDDEQAISCQFGDLEPSSMPEAPYSAESPGKVIRVWADTDRDDCGVITNTAFASASNDDELDSTDTITVNCPVIVRVPTLTIDKVVDAELITITGEAGDLEASPSIVTWTLTYTLANGPVTNAVITDEIPAGFVFLDASGGGLLVDGTVTWTFATLSESGSVTFRTTVDPETISRVAPTVNVAVIDSDETEPDDGQDSVTVEVEAPPLGGNLTPTPKPKPELPDTAAGIGLNGETVSVPLELLVALFVGSLGALTLANVKARSRRR